MLKRVREKIRARGARGIVGLGRSFRIMDDDGSGCLDSQEFSKALRDYRISDEPREHQAIFEAFDPDGNGQIDYDEFLQAILGPMNERRTALVKKAFGVIDKDGSGVLDINDIKGTYNAKKHPDVLSGKQTEEDVLLEFLDTFEAAYALKHGESKTRDGKVSLGEFIEYYQKVSASLDNDDYFEAMMTNAWNLGKKPPVKAAWCGEL